VLSASASWPLHGKPWRPPAANAPSHRHAGRGGPAISTPFSALAARLSAAPGRRALVFEGDQLVGIVSPTDVTRHLSIADLRTAR
jgi:hypothetical protein